MDRNSEVSVETQKLLFSKRGQVFTIGLQSLLRGKELDSAWSEAL